MRVSDAERAAGALAPERLSDAASRLREAGYVILEGALESEWVEELRAGLRVSIVKNRAKSHQRLRPEPPFSDARLVANRLAMQLLRACLGEGSLFYTGCRVHSVAPGETSGELHRDRRARHRWTATRTDAERTLLCLGYERHFGQGGGQGVLLPDSGRLQRAQARA